ncbi:flap endonuclease-1 [Pyrococcus furiosus DSM 3638]|uniref:Flap endonuclease 1 n=3 Tax=Pyrococcus furiosus TaxID=2261 RepID=FEN_PYRFU|nr:MULTISPECIES: flap endonuclease-1 [Pyrococcus]O93634.1 RecName: Full=Flap endonuclease 1; Short=FEN-1; AltName: Full=Flap structure-specific endonuclease 1 [Pyrococcus furiosus DSM 3638]1B43_A Chain A, PROTEIN (FEN-1) [Pyrococcus furiosus]1B43_B Chain B, PROTEIN (FEN-1) [Pyrococcus furiosus]AAD01514.1 endo/exonuclease [Pyrococcus furiosus DSM 3638]AAL81538.1 flap structure-specific endonuclease [Pyrococcus furiosus DSM 3638]AFN04195.1 flap endonuclease-1 [Pyrococcus furiosus COM1]MDK28688
MGVPIGEIIPRKEIELENLYGKKIAIDALNAIYQFLSTIRQKDGTPLMDSKGRITSHLSGLFYRTINLMEAGIKPVYVFDGEPPEFKKKELEKRREAREEAEEKWREALEKGEIEEARKYAQRATRVNEMLIEDAKKLLELMGIPIVQAPSEGEAQAAYMAAKGSVYASASQDYDSLLFGAPRLVRNLTITGKRKLPGKNVYVEIKPELIILEEVLKELKLTREKLIELAILVGTDYNPGGIKGIGLKKALEIVRHSKDPLAKFQKQSDVDLYAIKEFFLNPPVTDNYNLVWRDPDEEGILKFLCDEHDFSEERVKNGLERLKKAIKSGKQSTLESWFKR